MSGLLQTFAIVKFLNVQLFVYSVILNKYTDVKSNLLQLP